MHKKSIIQKTIQVGGWTLASRLFGLLREMLQVRYLGVGIISDAFFTALKIPNSLRKIFAEGALSAVFVPTIVKINKQENKTGVSSLISISFLVFEGILLLLCLLIFWKAEIVIRLISPGWYLCSSNDALLSGWLSWLLISLQKILPALFGCQPAQQVSYAVTYVRILISLIWFLSSSALLAGALQAEKHFFVPAFSSVLLNITFIAGLCLGLWYHLPVDFLCYAIIFGGFLQFLLHLFVYFKLNFNFGAITRDSLKHFKDILIKFFPCLLSMSIGEINLFMSTSLATYLPTGSLSLIYYANRFMGIPLGVFATAFSTILLPFFAHITTYAPSRLSFYLFESAKLIFWFTIPFTFIMSFLSEKIFETLFMSAKFTMAHVIEAHYILIAFLIGLFFFSLNKILLNVYYSLHETRITMLISVIALGTNYMLCKLLSPYFGTVGLALSFTTSGIIQTLTLSFFLPYLFNIKLYLQRFIFFVVRSSLQFLILGVCFIVTYLILFSILSQLLPSSLQQFFIHEVGFWLWVGPLCFLFGIAMIFTRKLCGIKLYFLD